MITEDKKYKAKIQRAIDSIKDGYNIRCSLNYIGDSLHGGMPDYCGAIFIKKDNLNLSYNFEIMDCGFRFFNVGELFGEGKDNKNALEKIAELNKAIAINLNLQLIHKKLEIDSLEKAMSKK